MVFVHLDLLDNLFVDFVDVQKLSVDDFELNCDRRVKGVLHENAVVVDFGSDVVSELNRSQPKETRLDRPLDLEDVLAPEVGFEGHVAINL